MDNIFSIDKNTDYTDELFFKLLKNENCEIEKIISTGQVTKAGEWLEDERDEWVILLQGESGLKFGNGNFYKMKAGDYLTIPANTKHRVESTSKNPPCIWLAIYIKS